MRTSKKRKKTFQLITSLSIIASSLSKKYIGFHSSSWLDNSRKQYGDD